MKYLIPQALMDAMGEFVSEGFKSGILKDTAGLKPTAEDFRVRSSGNRLKVTDGPFSESKEVVGGYAVVEVATGRRRWRWPGSSWSCTGCTGQRSKGSARCGRSTTCSRRRSRWRARGAGKHIRATPTRNLVSDTPPRLAPGSWCGSTTRAASGIASVSGRRDR